MQWRVPCSACIFIDHTSFYFKKAIEILGFASHRCLILQPRARPRTEPTIGSALPHEGGSPNHVHKSRASVLSFTASPLIRNALALSAALRGALDRRRRRGLGAINLSCIVGAWSRMSSSRRGEERARRSNARDEDRALKTTRRFAPRQSACPERQSNRNRPPRAPSHRDHRRRPPRASQCAPG